MYSTLFIIKIWLIVNGIERNIWKKGDKKIKWWFITGSMLIAVPVVDKRPDWCCKTWWIPLSNLWNIVCIDPNLRPFFKKHYKIC